MTILGSAYTWSGARCKNPHAVEVLPNRVLDELILLALLWPLWRTNLRVPVADVLMCSDATLTMGSVAQTCLSVEEATWLYAKAPGRHWLTIFFGAGLEANLLTRFATTPSGAAHI